MFPYEPIELDLNTNEVAVGHQAIVNHKSNVRYAGGQSFVINYHQFV